MLYLVATPIGNLSDITFRALDILKDVDGIICEDTRRTSQLLNHYQIKKPLLVLNDYNEVKFLPEIIQQLRSGKDLALVSDAGTPLISDPGYKLVRACLSEDIKIDSLPGPSSVITALTLSGLPPDKFIFLGYPPEKPGHRLDLFKKLKFMPIQTTVIFFAAPHKIIRVLEDMRQIFGDIELVLASELTKIHQNIQKNTINKWLEQKNFKGEITLIFRLP